MDKLSQSQLQKFHVRVEILSEFYKRKAYSDVIRESQEALELAIKALLRLLGVEPSFTHDPGKELAPYKQQVPAPLNTLVEEMIKTSKMLRRERELSFYGAVDFLPTEEYSKEDALPLIEFMNRLSQAFKETFS